MGLLWTPPGIQTKRGYAPASPARSAAESEAPWAWQGVTNVYFGDSLTWLRGEFVNTDPDARLEVAAKGRSTRLTGNGYFRNSISGQQDGATEITLSVLVSVGSVDSTDEGVFGNWQSSTGAPYVQIVSASGAGRSRQPRFFLDNGSSQIFADSTNGLFALDTPVVVTLTWSSLTDGKVRGYINGDLVGTSAGAITSAMPSGFQPLQVGTYFDNGNRRLDANIYWALSSNRAWSAREIKALAPDSFAHFRRRALLVPVSVGGGTGYTLTAESGTFSLTGQDTGLIANRLLTADQGSFALAGQDVTLRADRVISLDSGSFSLAGSEVGLYVNRLLEALSGTFTVTGQDAGLLVSRLLQADSGTFTLTGQDVDLVTAASEYTLTAESGSFSLSGQPADLLRSLLFSLDPGTFTLDGQDANLLRGYALTLASGTFSLTGSDTALIVSRVIEMESGTFTLSGQAVAFSVSGRGSVDSSRLMVVQIDDVAKVIEIKDAPTVVLI